MYLIHYFFSQFRHHKFRFIACILGYGVALGTILSIASYTDQMDRAIDQFFFVENNSVMVIERGVNIIQLIPFESQIPENITDSLSLIPGILFSVPIIFKNLANESKFTWLKTVLVGIDLTLLQTVFLQNIGLRSGRWAIPDQNETVVGPLVKEDRSIKLGDQIPVHDINLTVTGILESNDPFFDRFVYCEYDFVQSIYHMPGLCTIIYVLGNSDQFKDKLFVNEIENIIETQYSTVNLIDSEELDNALGNYYALIDVANLILAIFPMIIGIIFLFILIMLNVKDQEREFGMLQALGMSPPYIGGIVFGQAVLVTIIGFLLSIGVGYVFFIYSYFIVVEHAVDFANPLVYARAMIQQIPAVAYWRTFLISIFIGFIVAIYPSIKAMQVNVVQSFRKEA